MSVIARTMQLLDVLRDSDKPVTLTELSATTGLPLTTVHRLCTELLAEGVVERDDDRGIRIGARLWELGRQFEQVERYRVVASRFLHDLHEVSRATVELSHLVADELVVVDRLVAPDAERVEWRGRVERLRVDSPAGIAVLAAGAPFGGRRSAPPEPGMTLERALKDARTIGVARMPGHRPDGRVVLAAAVRTRTAVVGAVSLEARSDEAARAQSPSLLVTARYIGVALTG